MPRRTESAAQRAYDGVRNAILNGEYAPGDMLSETELGARFELSRTPVRAALLRLQEAGWITVYPQRGALVRELSEDESKHLTRARLIVEGGSLAELDSRRTRQLVTELENLASRQRNALDIGDRRLFADLDVEFHQRLVEAAGNPLVTGFYERLRDRQILYLTRGLDAVSGRGTEILEQHAGIRSLIADGDIPRAIDALREHLAHTHRALFP